MIKFCVQVLRSSFFVENLTRLMQNPIAIKLEAQSILSLVLKLFELEN
jgi:hypothetical protein